MLLRFKNLSKKYEFYASNSSSILSFPFSFRWLFLSPWYQSWKIYFFMCSFSRLQYKLISPSHELPTGLHHRSLALQRQPAPHLGRKIHRLGAHECLWTRNWRLPCLNDPWKFQRGSDGRTASQEEVPGPKGEHLSNSSRKIGSDGDERQGVHVGCEAGDVPEALLLDLGEDLQFCQHQWLVGGRDPAVELRARD